MGECDDKIKDTLDAWKHIQPLQRAVDRAKRTYERDVMTFGMGWTAVAVGVVGVLAAPEVGVVLAVAAASIGIGAVTAAISGSQAEDDREAWFDSQPERNEAVERFANARGEAMRCLHQRETGCGTRQGPGWRRPDGKCASWRDVENGTDH